LALKVPILSSWQRSLVVAGLIAVITLAHYLTQAQRDFLHLFYREVYLLPIGLAAFWFGLKGGMVSSVLVSLLYLPLVLTTPGEPAVHTAGNLVQVVLFFLVGAGLGWLRDRDQRQHDELRRAEGLAAMGRAVSSIAHDMKNPLMAIGGFVKQVRRKLDHDEASAKKLDIALNQVERLEAMVKDMLAFARPLKLETKPTDLDEMAAESLELVRQAKGEEVGLELSRGGLPPQDYDRHRLQEALLNLLTNAVEASPSGAAVRLAVAREGGEAWLAVEDQGPGIPAYKRDELANPFVTTKQEGTGLGLSIATKVAEAHGGRLEIGDAPGGGARVSLVLPLRPAEAQV
jgi:signal transduction histidine kinase